jgi:putative hydrolase of the HAD superfamily
VDLRQYRAVIFDLFHTLTSADVVHLSGKGTSEMLGVSREDWNEQLLKYSDDRLRGKITDPFIIIERMAHAIDRTITLETIKKAVANRIKRFRHALMSIDESNLDTLRRLKYMGKTLGLISNADVTEILGWQSSPLVQYFDKALFSCQVGFVKPEREIYESCISGLGVVPEDCLYVGDGGSDELKGAHDVGMKTVLTTHVISQLWPERIAAARMHADHVIGQITQIIE